MAEVEGYSTLRSYGVKTPLRRHRKLPIAFYSIIDTLKRIYDNPNFLDALLVSLAFIGFSFSFPFYPLLLVAILVAVIFATDLYHPFLGFVLLVGLVFPMLIYQVPAISWAFLIVISASLIYGYKHFRTMAFMYLLFAFAFNPAGYLLWIPLLIAGVLIVGYKRGMVLAVIAILAIVMFSGLSGVQNYSYILYNAKLGNSYLNSNQPNSEYFIPNKAEFNIVNFSIGAPKSIAVASSGSSLEDFSTVIPSAFKMLTIDPSDYLAQLGIVLVAVFLIDYFAVSGRSKYKGTKASLAGAIIPIGFLLITRASAIAYSFQYYLLIAVSFGLALAGIFLLELYNVNIVKALDVRKQDMRMKFGEAFEDIEAGNVTERFDEIGNYEATKAELRRAIINPIEQRSISRAYNINPTRGILFFGPPGTGKTLMMRAVANEIHASFFYVKAPDIISASPGATEKRISEIFATARKHAPCVLFFDEIDSLAMNRDRSDIDDTHRHALTQLLIEMDGFQKIKNVIMIGATNTPNLLDNAILRPGRFDKLISMSLPDNKGRKEIFKIYLKKLPISEDVDLDRLAEVSKRYSPADIKVICENVAKEIAEEAMAKHTVLEISQEDIINQIKSTKPSVSLAKLEEYEKFRIDIERRSIKEKSAEKELHISREDIIGLSDAKKAIEDAVEKPLTNPSLMKKYDIKPINGILLFGPPGNGKSMLMRAIKEDLGKDITMLEIDGSNLLNEGADKAISSLKEIFNRARENVPSIIFIDEVDSIIPKRKTSSEWGIEIVSEVLRMMDGIKQSTGVVIIGATNRPDEIDPAALRPGRFDKLIFVKPPGAKDRSILFEENLSNVPAEDIDIEKLGNESEGFTGADIVHVCSEAKRTAMEESIGKSKEAKISMKVLEEIIRKTKPSAPEDVIKEYQLFLEKYGER